MNYLIHFFNSSEEIDRIVNAKTISEIIPIFSKSITERLTVGDYVTIYNPQTDSSLNGIVHKVAFNDGGSYVFYAVLIT